MNMKFSCEICKYSTERKADYEKHIISGKHKKASIELGKVNTGTEKNNECVYCNYVSNSQNNMIVHYRSCKKILDMGKQIEELKKQLVEKEHKLENLAINREDDIKFIKGMASKAGTVAEKSVDAVNKTADAVNKTADIASQSMKSLQFLQTYYKDAPALEPPMKWLPNYKTVGKIELTESDKEEQYYDEDHYKVEKRRKIMSEMDTTKEDEFVLELMGKQNIMCEEIGKMIIDVIKRIILRNSHYGVLMLPDYLISLKILLIRIKTLLNGRLIKRELKCVIY